jgi:hypothetical protein
MSLGARLHPVMPVRLALHSRSCPSERDIHGPNGLACHSCGNCSFDASTVGSSCCNGLIGKSFCPSAVAIPASRCPVHAISASSTAVASHTRARTTSPVSLIPSQLSLTLATRRSARASAPVTQAAQSCPCPNSSTPPQCSHRHKNGRREFH